MKPVTKLFLLAINAYQRYGSPRKGFACAYRVHTGCASCSAFGYRAIRRFGAFRGVQILRKRMYLCGVAHRRFSPRPLYRPLAQRGACDLGCDSPFDGDCDIRGSRVTTSLCDGVGCCDFWGGDSRKSRGSSAKQKRKEPKVHIPNRRHTHRTG